MNNNLDNIPEFFLKNTKKDDLNNSDGSNIYISSDEVKSNSARSISNVNKETIWILATFLILFDIL